MITVMRRYFKGRVLQIVAWLTIISVVGFWGGAGFMKSGRRGHGSDTIIVTINSQEIEGNEYRRVVNLKEDFIRRVRLQYGQYADMLLQMQGLNADPRRQAYDTLVIDSLLNQVAEQLHITLRADYISYKLAEPTMLQQVIMSIVPGDLFDAQGAINSHALDRQLRHAGLTQDVFNEMIGEVLERDLVSALASAASYTPKLALREQYVQEYVKKRYSLLTIPFEPMLKKEQAAPVDDEELKAFFTRESKRYMMPEKRIAKVWTFEQKDFAVTVEEQEVADYYKQHQADKYTEKPEMIQVRRILFASDEKAGNQEALEKATSLRTQLEKDPALFAAKAKELSVDKETSKNGGLLPFFAKGTKDEQLEKAAFMLRDDGAISEPVITKDGVELLQRVARKAAEYKPLKSVESEIRTLLATRKFQDMFMEDMRPVMEQPEGSEQALTTYTQKKGVVAKSLTVDANDKSKIAHVIMSLPEKGINCFVDNGKGIAVQLTEVQARFLPPLETVKDAVLADLHKERAEKKFAAFLRELTSKAATEPLEELAKKAGGTVSTVDWISPQDTTRIEELRKKQLPVSKMVHLDKTGTVALQIDEKQGVIVRVDEIEPIKTAEFESKLAELMQKLGREESYFFAQGFVASLYRNATIKPNKSLLDLDEELAI